MPVLTAMPLPQYVFGTMSPKPTLKKVIAISHIALRRFACSSSWNLCKLKEVNVILYKKISCNLNNIIAKSIENVKYVGIYD